MAAFSSRKNVNIELLRLFACLLVIYLHVRPVPVSDSVILKPTLAMLALSSTAVGSFFMISGAFLPDTSSILKAWKRCLLHIILPAFLLILAANLLHGWISGQMNILESIRSCYLPMLPHNILKAVLLPDANYFGGYTGHLWYVITYTHIILVLPLLRPFLKKLSVGLTAVLLLALFIFLAIPDIKKVLSLIIPAVSPSVSFIPSLTLPMYLEYFLYGILYFGTGYLIYRALKAIKKPYKKRLCLISGAVLVLCLISSYYLQLRLYHSELSFGELDAVSANVPYFLTWDSSISFIASCLLMIFILCLDIRPEAVCGMICFLSSLSYPIYLIHFPLITKLITCGFRDQIYSFLQLYAHMSVSLCSLIYTVIIFIITAFFSYIITSVARLMYHGVRTLLSQSQGSSTTTGS